MQYLLTKQELNDASLTSQAKAVNEFLYMKLQKVSIFEEKENNTTTPPTQKRKDSALCGII